MLIGDVLKLPTQVLKGDFVLVLTEGIRKAQQTVDSYALTPGLVHAFDSALALVNAALQDQRSHAAYLHGSFGSGKSHFMAVLDLMLDGHSAPWARPELHPLRAKYTWIGQKKILRLPLHMIGAESIEQNLFQSYIGWVSENHPSAPVPALYGDQALFENATHLRGNMGDARFFEVLNAGQPAAAGWGKLKQVWTPEAMDQAVSSPELREREKLFSALVKTHFPAFAKQTTGFLELDKGLAVMTSHASDLGYHAVVLFMDELILWLHSHISNREFIQNEALKLTKLKEAQHEQRAIPLVSFLARQRDLADLVGKDAVGLEMASIRDSLAWSSGRFGEIPLEDRNLPAIVERRVLQPKDDSSREKLYDAFARVKKTHVKGWQALLGSFGEEADFKKVYPFSPALVETMVALSSCLQRERTALRILMELLVDHVRDLELGQVVPLGDIYDVIAGGEDAFDLVMRDRFEHGKSLYANHFLPLIQAEHGTGNREKCQRLRDTHPARLGCSQCAHSECRNANRIAKTLLLAALVPETKEFKGLRASGLVYLNPGAVNGGFLGNEVGKAADMLRRWAGQIGQLKVGEGQDPEVFVRLEGVDLTPILSAAAAADNLGARKRLLREILFSALELGTDSPTVEHPIKWRGTTRKGTVRFGNVRDMADTTLVCPPECEWQVVIDYPFDEPGFTPEHDLKRVDDFREQQTARYNLSFVWLPSFFSDKLERELGQLAVIEHVLSGDSPKTYLGHLRTDDQSRAKVDLESLRSQKRAQIRRALDQAYGIAGVSQEGLLDPSRHVEEHVVSLQPGLPGRPLLAAGFSEALQQLGERLIEHRYPHHPRFTTVSGPKLERTRVLVERILDTSEQRMAVSKAEADDLKEIAEPLGLARVTDTTAHLNVTRLREIEQQRVQASNSTPTVEQAKRFVDPADTMGLLPEVSDLMAVLYAVFAGRTLERNGRAFELEKLGKIPGDVELVKPDLPTEVEWQSALTKAGTLFGIAVAGKALTARNLTLFSTRLMDGLQKVSAADKLPSLLDKPLQRWAPEDEPPRMQTAKSGIELMSGLRAGLPVDHVRFLAAFEPKTSAQALQKSLLSAASVGDKLRGTSDWVIFDTVSKLVNDPAKANRAGHLLEELSTALKADELTIPLAPRLTDLVQKAAELLQVRTTPPPPEPRDPDWEFVLDKTYVANAGEIVQALGELTRDIESAGSADVLRIELVVHRRTRS